MIKTVIAVLIGVLLGLVFTIRSLDSANRGVVAGAWHGAPRDGSGEADPYALAAIARSSRLPLGSTEGLTFVAATDSKGHGLDPACDYALTGPMPAARFWTISLLDPEGFPIAGKADRYGFTSAEVLRDRGDPVAITIAPEARSGNWLPNARNRPYVLMLRLYDTTLSTGGAIFDARGMPTITKRGCR